jgi:hypothetical protein
MTIIDEVAEIPSIIVPSLSLFRPIVVSIPKQEYEWYREMFNLNIFDSIGKYVDAALEVVQILIETKAMEAENNGRLVYKQEDFMELADRIKIIREKLHDNN